MFDSIKQKKIHGKEYQINLLPAKQGFTIAMKLSKTIIPAIGGSVDALDQMAVGGFSRVALLLTEQIDDQEIMSIIEALTDQMAVDGEPVNFDRHFMANYGALIEVLEFALMENFESFFEAKGLKARFSTLKAKMVEQAKALTPTEQSE